MAQPLTFKRYTTTSALTSAKTSFAVGDIVFDKEAKIIYIVTAKSNSDATLEPYYGNNAIQKVSCSGATITVTLSDGTTSSFTVNNVANAGTATNATNDADGKKISTTYLKKITGATPVVYHISSLLGKYGVKITLPLTWNPQQSGMFAFTVRLYVGYQYTDIVISGYDYGSNHWHLPKAEIIGGTSRYTIKFGWDTEPKKLFIWIGKLDTSTAFSYGGLSIFDVHCGHSDCDMSTGWTSEFCSASELEALETLGGIQSTLTPVLNAKADGTNASGTWAISVSGNAASATTSGSASKLTSSAGSATLPVYFTGGVPKAINTTDVGISITGSAASATKATQDANGNVITSTYATKTELAGKSDSTHTHLYAGSDTAGGIATKAKTIATEVGTTNVNRPVFFAYNGDTTKVVYDNDFKYNPSSNTLTIGSGTLTGTDYSGNAATANSALTAGTADKTQATLTVGNKNFNGSSAVTITAEDLGLSSAMKFIGITTTTIEDGSTTNTITIDNASVDAEKGNVVLNGHLEYVWTGSKWEVLGDEQSYALKSIQVLAGDGLSGGGTLQSAITISHKDTSSQASMTTGGRTYINSITLDDYGHVTALGTKTETDQTTISGNAGSATKLQTSKSINGTAFDGSADITTDKWGTARNIYISDNDGVNKGVATEVNGSGNVILKLPTTINASVTGSAGSISGMTFDDNTAVSSLGWEDNASGSTQLPTVNTMAYWNGAYAGTNSNLEYSKNGIIIGSSNIGTQSVAYASNSGKASYATYLGDSSSNYTSSTLTTALAGKSDTDHEHSNYVTLDTEQTIIGKKYTSERLSHIKTTDLPDGYRPAKVILNGVGVDTGIAVNTLSTPALTMSFTPASAGDWDWYGTTNTSTATICGNICVYSGTSDAYIRHGSAATNIQGTLSNMKYANEVVLTASVSGTTVTVTATADSSTSSITGSLNGGFVNTGNIFIGKGRNAPNSVWSYFYITDGSTSIFKGEGAYEVSSGNYGFYDYVSQTFKTVSGASGTVISTNVQYALMSDVPTNMSSLKNDANYATTDDIPTKTSELINDSFGSIATYNISFLTQSAYNALTTKESNTIYFIKEG